WDRIGNMNWGYYERVAQSTAQGILLVCHSDLDHPESALVPLPKERLRLAGESAKESDGQNFPEWIVGRSLPAAYRRAIEALEATEEGTVSLLLHAGWAEARLPSGAVYLYDDELIDRAKKIVGRKRGKIISVD